MYRSVVIPTRNTRNEVSAASAFVECLASDLKLFGRDDVALVSVGDLMVFAWTPEFSSKASKELRDAAMEHRLRGQSAVLASMEKLLPAEFFDPIDIDLTKIDPEIVVCEDKQHEQLFDYIAWGQSVPADIKNFRNIKVLVFDNGQATKRVMGAILLKSPMYFDGARDTHLGWPKIFTMIDGERHKSQGAIDLRNKALKSIYNVGVCMAASPYDVQGIGKLIASLCFAPPIITHIEGKFAQPVLGMTTTGGWGGNAAQYDRLYLADRAAGDSKALFVRTHGARMSMNFPIHLFSERVILSAMRVIREDTSVRARDYAEFATEPKTAVRAFRKACQLIGLPIRATATNSIAHYFGSVSDDCTSALRTIASIDSPPLVRSIPVGISVDQWRSQFKPATTILNGRRTKKLSALAT